jgi:hypothetical protein
VGCGVGGRERVRSREDGLVCGTAPARSHALATGCPERATHTSPGQRPGETVYPPFLRTLKGRGHRATCTLRYVAPLQGAVGGVDPVPRVGTLGWYVRPLQGQSDLSGSVSAHP